MNRFSRFGIVAAALALGIPAAAQSPGLSMLQSLERGQWQLVSRSGGPPINLCLGDARQLLQVMHRGAQCSVFPITDQQTVVGVSYDCGAVGNGTTRIRRETSRLAQIETQGIVRNAPFSESFEARHAGACTR